MAGEAETPPQTRKKITFSTVDAAQLCRESNTMQSSVSGMGDSFSGSSSEDGPNYKQRFFWLLLTVPLLGALWGSVPMESYRSVTHLILTVSSAYITGSVVGLFPKIPPLLGMMIAGAVLRNFEIVQISPNLAAKLRSMALVVILLRAGMGLNLSVLKKLSATCIRLTLMPCFAEAICIMVVSHFLLGLPLLWGLLLGFVLAAVSPAVIVPAMIDLTHRKLGTGKGIPTLVMAAASFDDVAAITGFGVVFSIIFQSSDRGITAWTLLGGPLEALIGFVIGLVLGILIATIFHAHREDTQTDEFDLLCPLYIVVCGAAVVFISTRLNFGGVGPLAAITASAAAAAVWKRQAQKDDSQYIVQIESCSTVLKYLWIVFEPVLFSMIGLEIRFTELNSAIISKGLLTLAICLVIRIGVSFLAVSWSTFTFREKMFICISWLPKATVQAALAPSALDMVRSMIKDGKPVPSDALAFSETVLTLGVLAIIITAPIGAVLISLLAPKLLKAEQFSSTVDESDNTTNL